MTQYMIECKGQAGYWQRFTHDPFPSEELAEEHRQLIISELNADPENIRVSPIDAHMEAIALLICAPGDLAEARLLIEAMASRCSEQTLAEVIMAAAAVCPKWRYQFGCYLTRHEELAAEAKESLGQGQSIPCWESLPEAIRENYAPPSGYAVQDPRPPVLGIYSKMNEIRVLTYDRHTLIPKTELKADVWKWDTDNPGQGRWLQVG